MLSRTTPSGKTVYYNSKTRSRQSEKPQGSGSSLRNIAYAIGAVLLLTVAAAGPNLVENLGGTKSHPQPNEASVPGSNGTGVNQNIQQGVYKAIQ